MAKSNRGIHVSPGIYTSEEVLQSSVKSLGITTLGAVGETLKGPAFQPVSIANWREFQNVFGGTSADKFSGSKYPKYELPYIAKSFLSASQQLEVVRVLGLSGYNAGPAWLITATSTDGNKVPIAVLRSRGGYKAYITNTTASTEDDCVCQTSNYDFLQYQVGEPTLTATEGCRHDKYNMKALALAPYTSLYTSSQECADNSLQGEEDDYMISTLNFGRFKIKGIVGKHPYGTTPTTGESGYFEYAVSFNPGDADYILNVLGTEQENGDAPVYVESLYDMALQQGIANGTLTAITSTLEEYNAYNLSDYCHLEGVNDLLSIPEQKLSKKYVGRRYLATQDSEDANGVKITCHLYDYLTGKPMYVENSAVTSAGTEVTVGQIYTVAQYTDASGKRHYYYAAYDPSTVVDESGATLTGSAYYSVYDSLYEAEGGNKSEVSCTLVKNGSDGLYYRMLNGEVAYVSCDLNDYKSAYRYASTPWIVSNLKGDYDKMELSRMFRFHTISDGDASNNEIKVSIENILPDEGYFDVVIRDINDNDASPVILEKYTKCNMVVGDNNYIAYRIGSYDGTFETKSKYVTVEVYEASTAHVGVPAGFMGYPKPDYSGLQIVSEDEHNDIEFPEIQYNRDYDTEIKNKKQYFGLSDISGVDIDLFTYKGRTAYIDNPVFLSAGFHLDCRVNDNSYGAEGKTANYTVDGDTGYTFQGVSVASVTTLYSESPIISKEEDMEGTIYENKNLRKFTVYFYGGFDGWDVYREQRSNTDDFKYSQYKGVINTKSGEGRAFSRIMDTESLSLNQAGITSDWYAYLSGIRQFANPSSVDINVFVTPGIDMLNNPLLVQEAIEMIEEERADSIYIPTMPDKESGMGDYADEMLDVQDVADVLTNNDFDSNYTATYYPWVKYEDTDNNQYIYLPATKDVVRNLAETDNTYQPWFAPAGMNRGTVDAVRAKKVLKLSEEDTLYENGINPIKTFSSDGTIKVWGQKTIQLADNQLNRIATRRLLLRLRKLIVIATQGLIFEQLDSTTKSSLLSAINPILEDLRSNRGLSDYKVEVDDSEELKERYEMAVTIYIKPYYQLEYLSISFVLTQGSISFDDI